MQKDAYLRNGLKELTLKGFNYAINEPDSEGNKGNFKDDQGGDQVL